MHACQWDIGSPSASNEEIEVHDEEKSRDEDEVLACHCHVCSVSASEETSLNDEDIEWTTRRNLALIWDPEIVLCV
jgi:hypothetical protein